LPGNPSQDTYRTGSADCEEKFGGSDSFEKLRYQNSKARQQFRFFEVLIFFLNLRNAVTMVRPQSAVLRIGHPDGLATRLQVQGNLALEESSSLRRDYFDGQVGGSLK
jgi:hypothetical protein